MWKGTEAARGIGWGSHIIAVAAAWSSARFSSCLLFLPAILPVRRQARRAFSPTACRSGKSPLKNRDVLMLRGNHAIAAPLVSARRPRLA